MKMLKFTFLLLFVLVIILPSCDTRPPLDQEKERDILLQTDKTFSITSGEKGAGEAFKEFLTEDALQLPAGQVPVIGRDSIYESMKPGQENYTLLWEPRHAEVALSGELGYTWGFYTLSFLDAERDTVSRKGKYLNIWKKQADGSWKVAVDIGNSTYE